MKASSIASKPKPKVAYVNQEAASTNIRTKLTLMASVLEIHVAEISEIKPLELATKDDLFPLLPKSVRQFNLWDSLSLPALIQDLLPKFSRNSHSTLIKLKGLNSAVCIAVKAASRSKDKEATPTKDDNVARLKRSLALANSLRSILEIELIDLRSQCASQNEDIKKLNLRIDELHTRIRAGS